MRAGLKTLSQYWLDPIVRTLARLGVTPNALTCTGFAITALAGLLAASGNLLAAGIVSLVGGGFDMLDGALARSTGRASKFGALLDSTLDRYGEGAVLLGVLVYGARSDQVEVVALGGLALTGSFMVSYVKARAEGLDIECEVGVLTRTERVILLGAGLMTGLVLPVLAVVAVLANVTAVQRLVHVWRASQTPRGVQAARLDGARDILEDP